MSIDTQLARQYSDTQVLMPEQNDPELDALVREIIGAWPINGQ